MTSFALHGVGVSAGIAIGRAQLVSHGLVNLGGDVRAIGTQVDGAPWRVGIQHPRGAPGKVIAYVDLADGAVATSGDYERYFEVDGHRYCHLLDARTGWPTGHWQSATVVAPLAILAGSYATIAMLLAADAPAFLAQQHAGDRLGDTLSAAHPQRPGHRGGAESFRGEHRVQ